LSPLPLPLPSLRPSPSPSPSLRLLPSPLPSLRLLPSPLPSLRLLPLPSLSPRPLPSPSTSPRPQSSPLAGVWTQLDVKPTKVHTFVCPHLEPSSQNLGNTVLVNAGTSLGIRAGIQKGACVLKHRYDFGAAEITAEINHTHGRKGDGLV
jgi:hypothetical protein